jgi:tripartite-type tricarboxylate transporter receptor subunit TctC
MKAIGIVAALSALLTAGNAFAQASYPDKPLRILVGFVAGGPADTVARVVGDKFTEAWGTPVVIEKVTGSGGNMAATERVAKAAPDGYTLLLGASGPFVIHPSLYPRLPFDPVKDFAPITQLCFTANVLVVNNDVPAKSVAELTALARAQPGKLTYGSAGVGTTQHLSGELFKMMTGVNMVHVPYRGEAPALTDLLGGQVQLYFGTLPGAIEYIRVGKLRALAVTTATRSEALPDVPTLSEFVPNYEASGWQGIGVPKNTPTEIVDKLNKEINAALADPKIKARLAALGATVLQGSPAEFGKLIADDTEKWAKVIRAANIKPEG